jgi:cation diffusion facilitator CzcD-associated flavoprotein CzcO
VVQRTPSSVDVRANAPIDADWFEGVATPGWQQRWLENFTENQAGGTAEVDLVQDGWTDLSRRIRGKIMQLPADQRTPANMLAAFEDSDFEKMEEIRARVDSIVEDDETAQNLKAWYRQLCKRPCFHDAYLQAFNNPGARLIDTDGKGVEKITEKSFVVAGVEYEVDCIIYASGFEVGTEYKRRAGFEVVGRDGLTLTQAWGDGMRSKHGIHVHGFPNAFFVQPTQGANLISNVPHNLTDTGRTIAGVVSHGIERGSQQIEVSREAQDAWVDLLLTGVGRMMGAPDCTPGYYNNEGQAPTAASRLNVGYPAGAAAYFRYIKKWREAGDFDGLEFR